MPAPTLDTTNPVSAGVPIAEISAPHLRPTGEAVIQIDDPAIQPCVIEDAHPPSRKQIRKLATETETLILDDILPGYPRLAAFEASETSFSIYRRFKFLRSRVLLELQHEIQCLEDDLAAMDEIDSTSGASKILKSIDLDHRRARNEGTDRKRSLIVARICEKFTQYDDLLLKTHAINALQDPSDRDYRSVRNWFYNERPLASEKEESYIKRRDDLLSLRQGRPWTYFHGLVEWFLATFDSGLTQKLFRSKEQRRRTTNKNIQYFEKSSVETVVNMIAAGLMFILIVLPPVLLSQLDSSTAKGSYVKIILFVVFTCFFTITVKLIIGATRVELFAALAVYCAVLATFVGNAGEDQCCAM